MTIGMWVIVLFIALCGGGFCAYAIAYAAKENSVSAGVIAFVCGLVTVAICAAIIWWGSTSESGKRALKEQQSDLNGGLERTVTLYSYNGDEIKSWSGKFDVSSSETETYFDIDGKRVIIHGGIVVNEEAQ